MWSSVQHTRNCSTTVIFLLLVLPAVLRSEPLSERVLVVYNKKSHDSRKVADYYMRRRGVPGHNRCAISVADSSHTGTTSVPWPQLDSVIRGPIRRCIKSVGKNKILYIVLTYGTPYRFKGSPRGVGVAIDQYVADLWDELGGLHPAENPYYAKILSRLDVYPSFVPLAEYRRFPSAQAIYSVWRLDAATPALAEGLVDKALVAEEKGASGRACIDRRGGRNMNAIPDSGYGAAGWDLFRAAEFFRRAGIPVVEDTGSTEFGTPPAPARCDDVVFYAGWYSLNHYNDVFTWAPGAIGIHLDSLSALNPRGGSNWSANAIKRGITITSGALEEPYLGGLPHPDGIVHDLLAGANVGDAFLRNTAMLKWMIINIGDPLYRPKFRIPADTTK